MSWCDDPVDLFKLTVMVIADTEPPTSRADAAYIHAEVKENELLCLETAAELYHQEKVGVICLSHPFNGEPHVSPLAPPGSIGYTGSKRWNGQLLKMGVRAQDICLVEQPDLMHTITEATGFIDTAKMNGWFTGYTVAPPFHQVRCLTSIVTRVLRTHPVFKVFAKPAKAQPWHDDCLYSQGITTVTREQSLEGELERLNRWYAQGNLVSCKEVLEYLRQRDS